MSRNVTWHKVNTMLRKMKYEVNITLKHLVFGYKTFDKDYIDFNYFLTISFFTIYKAYYVS